MLSTSTAPIPLLSLLRINATKKRRLSNIVLRTPFDGTGDTSGTGAEDAGSLTGTLTFTDVIDGDTALTFCVADCW